MLSKINCLLFFLSINYLSYSQELDTTKLNAFFTSLENREEAMGSIAISKNRQIIYSRAIGHQAINGETFIPANTATNYKIWSVTKTYTATMIFQMIEEGLLSLETTIDKFYPSIPDAKVITIQHLLTHKSGIHDFTQFDTSESWQVHLSDPNFPKLMVDLIATYPLDFNPNTQFRYSNSNYLLLGYIIQTLDKVPYEKALSNRISDKIGLKQTHFSNEGLDKLENKAHSFKYQGQWKSYDEGGFSGPIPGAAGGIVATPSDMAKFIAALFTEQLISQKSLDRMLEMDESYGHGIMQNPFKDKEGFGHTGGYIASESSLFYYPEDSIAIAYCTNGIVIRKEEILDNVLKICHELPFSVSMNRKKLGLIILGICLFLFTIMRLKFEKLVTNKNLLSLGIVISVLFWVGVAIAGQLAGEYHFVKDGLSRLEHFYSSSGTFMASIQLVIVILSIPFLITLFKTCKKTKLHLIPLLPLLLLPISMAGASLFPYPNSSYPLFANGIILTFISPFLAAILWKKTELKKLRLFSIISFFVMIIMFGLVLSRPSFPAFVHEYFGLIQRGLFVGLTLWLSALSLCLKDFHFEK